MRRNILRRMACAFQPCPEFAFWEFDNQREYRNHVERVNQWHCSRHSHPQEVLSVSNPRTEWLSELNRESGSGVYFGSSGFIYGGGYRAFAKDFPVGTRIRVIAEVILPNAQPPHPESASTVGDAGGEKPGGETKEGE